jgi:hypothetical protein
MVTKQPGIVNILGLFEDLASMLERVRLGTDLSRLSLNSESSRQILAHCARGLPFVQAFFLACCEGEFEVRRPLFGTSQLRCDLDAGELVASECEQSLTIIFDDSRDTLSNHRIAPNKTILFTDFETFRLYRSSGDGSGINLCMSFAAKEVSEEIEFNGSFWESIYPSHFALVSRTLACSFPRKLRRGSFFGSSHSRSALVGEEEALKHLNILTTSSADLLCVNDFFGLLRTQLSGFRLLSEQREGEHIIRRYTSCRSPIFDFGTPFNELSRGDFVATYFAGGKEFHRDFFVSPHEWGSGEENLKLAAFDILHMLAIRRGKLFRMGFSRRVYNILFPPVALFTKAHTENGYALFPFLSIYRTPNHGFRRTLSLSFLVLPTCASAVEGGDASLTSRTATLAELHQLKRDLLLEINKESWSSTLSEYLLGGPGRDFFRLGACSSIPMVLQEVTKVVFDRILRCDYRKDDDRKRLVDNNIFISGQESKIVTMGLVVDWKAAPGYTQPWERWLATGNDRTLRNSLFRILYYSDFLDSRYAEASREVVRLDELNIGNTMGADIGGMTLYNPQESLKVVLYPKNREQYPNYSIVRWMAWQVYIDSALASMKALIYRFHPVLESRGSLYSLMRTLDEMIEEFVDFYDLAIRDYFYRKEYEKLRLLMQIDSDYTYLLTKFSTSKDDESLREQRLINKLVLGLMISTVTVTVVSTIAQEGKLGMSVYIVASLCSSAAFVWIGYALFDPIRSGIRSLRERIERFWR